MSNLEDSNHQSPNSIWPWEYPAGQVTLKLVISAAVVMWCNIKGTSITACHYWSDLSTDGGRVTLEVDVLVQQSIQHGQNRKRTDVYAADAHICETMASTED